MLIPCNKKLFIFVDVLQEILNFENSKGVEGEKRENSTEWLMEFQGKEGKKEWKILEGW